MRQYLLDIVKRGPSLLEVLALAIIAGLVVLAVTGRSTKTQVLLGIVVLIAVILLPGLTSDVGPPPSEATATTTTTVPPTYIGGCDPFAVYSQGRASPSGATVREMPYLWAPEVRTVGANAGISVDGWIETAAPYPGNRPPWDSAVWFRLTSGAGFVSFAGVRAEPTTPEGVDGPNEGGQPVEYGDECELRLAQ